MNSFVFLILAVLPFIYCDISFTIDDPICHLYPVLSDVFGDQSMIHYRHNVLTPNHTDICEIRKDGFLPLDVNLEVSVEKTYLVLNSSGQYQELVGGYYSTSVNRPCKNNPMFFLGPGALVYPKHIGPAPLNGVETTLYQNGRLLDKAYHTPYACSSDIIQDDFLNDNNGTFALQEYIQIPGTGIFGVLPSSAANGTISNAYCNGYYYVTSKGYFPHSKCWDDVRFSNIEDSTPFTSFEVQTANPVYTHSFAVECPNNGTHFTQDTSCGLNATLLPAAPYWCRLNSDNSTCSNFTDTALNVTWTTGMQLGLNYSFYASFFVVEYSSLGVTANGDCNIILTGFGSTATSGSVEVRQLNLTSSGERYLYIYEGSSIGSTNSIATDSHFYMQLSCPAGGNITISHMYGRSSQYLLGSTGHWWPMVIHAVSTWYYATYKTSRGNYSFYELTDVVPITSLFNKRDDNNLGADETNSSLVLEYPLVLRMNETLCQELTDVSGKCFSDICEYSVVYKTCNTGEMALVTLQGPTVGGSCKLLPGEKCSLQFDRPLKDSFYRFVGSAGQNTFYGAYWQVVGTENHQWSWNCAPWCGIPWLENLSTPWRWFFGILMLLVIYFIFGFVFQKLKECGELIKAPSSGWGSAFRSFSSTLYFIWFCFIAVLNVIMCRFLDKYYRKVYSYWFPSEDMEPLKPTNSPMNSSTVIVQNSAASGRPKRARGGRPYTMACLLILLPFGGCTLHTAAPTFNSGISPTCANVGAHYLSMIPFENGFGFNISVQFELSMTDGSSACFQIKDIQTPFGTRSLSKPFQLEITDVKPMIVLATADPRKVGIPVIGSGGSAECPTGGNHYCDADHKSAYCPAGSQECSYHAVEGNGGGPCYLPGKCHYCIVASMWKSPKKLCRQYPILNPKFQPSIGLSLNGTVEIIRIDALSSTEIAFPYGELSFLGSYALPGLPIGSTIFECGDGAFILNQQKCQPGVYGRPDNPCFYQYYNGVWYSDWNAFWSNTVINTSRCDEQPEYNITIYRFDKAAIDLDTSLSSRFMSLGTPYFQNDTAYLSLATSNKMEFILHVNASYIVLDVDMFQGTVTSVEGYGAVNQTIAGLMVNITVASPGTLSLVVQDITHHEDPVYFTRFVTNDTSLSVPYIPTLETETVNITLCDEFGMRCSTQLKEITFQPYIPQTFTDQKTAGGGESVDKPGFWDGGLGSNFRFSTWSGMSKFKLWADVLAFVAVFLVLTVVTAVGVSFAKKLKMKSN